MMVILMDGWHAIETKDILRLDIEVSEPEKPRKNSLSKPKQPVYFINVNGHCEYAYDCLESARRDLVHIAEEINRCRKPHSEMEE